MRAEDQASGGGAGSGSGAGGRPLRILHTFRAPVGGLFRHVHDVAKAQAAAGHQVGLICDSMTGSPFTERLLKELAPTLSLGIHRLPMYRNPTFGDLPVLALVRRLARDLEADVLHGHGAKGGVYARLGGVIAPNSGPVRCYTPHGGSLNFYPGSFAHKVFMAIERLLERGTDLFLFESAFIRDRYYEFVCPSPRPTRIALNGLYAHEFDPVIAQPGATDFLYVGEFREAKGIDTLVEAVALLAGQGLRPTLTMIGSGPSEARIRALVEAHGLAAQFTWRGVTPAAEAFRMGRIMVVPSRFESLPYIVLEAVGGRLPIISTDVGGIPEIIPAGYPHLIHPNDAPRLAEAMRICLATPPETLAAAAADLSNRVRGIFTVERMVETIIGGYRDAAVRRRPRVREAG